MTRARLGASSTTTSVGPGRVDPGQRVVHPPADRLGQAQAGFVHGEDLRVAGQPAHDRDHLLLAAGQGAGRLPQVRSDLREQFKGEAERS